MKKLIPFLLFFVLIQNLVYSQEIVYVGETELQVTEIIDGLDVPWEMKWGPDGFIWITERDGIVSRINVDTGEKHVILDIQNQVWQSSESGMLGMEIHPNFNSGSPYVFLAYTYLSGGAKEKIVCYEYDSSNDQLINEVVLLEDIPANSTHSGCRLLALNDLTMLITTGDVQDWMSAQDLSALSGKTLRMSINTDDGSGGQIPADNPIPGSYVWSWGHRNAQGLALSPDGIIYSSEHGPSNDDELNILQPGGNYGWPNVQGYCDNNWVDDYYAEDLTNSYTEIDYCEDNNVIESMWSSGSSTIATSDIIWYDHPSIPEFQNTLLMTVLKDKNLVRFELSEDGSQVESYTEFFNNEWGRLRDICVSPDGKIYLATNGYSWPSQPPNQIIELNPNFNNSSIDENNSFHNVKVLNNNGSYTITSSQCDFSVFDMTGRLLFESFNKESLFLSNTDFSSGLYNVILHNGKDSKMVQIVF
jgi:glucose/arabinose dehydrogenase